MSEKSEKSILTKWLTHEKHQQLIENESSMQVESMRALVMEFSGADNDDPLGLDRTYEAKLVDVLSKNLEEEFTTQELNDLKAAAQDPILSSIQEAKNGFQRLNLEAKDSPEAAAAHLALLQKPLTPARSLLIDQLHDILGESRHDQKLAILMFKQLMGTGAGEESTMDHAAIESLKSLSKKTMASSYDKISDEDLSYYLQALQQNPYLIREHQVIRQSILEFAEDLMKVSK